MVFVSQCESNGSNPSQSGHSYQPVATAKGRIVVSRIGKVPLYVELQRKLGIQLPIFVAITLLSAKDVTIYPTANSASWGWFSISPIKEEVLAPEAILEDAGPDFPQAVRPALDTVWQPPTNHAITR